jgi:D-alanine-D-alanine ligase
MKIAVLQPDYSTSSVDYQYYDPPRDLAILLPNDEVHTIFLNKLTTYKQLKALQPQGFDIFVNLCEGYLEWEVPSIDVIIALELLGLPYTGPTTELYDPPKTLMKYVAYCAGISTSSYSVIEKTEDIDAAVAILQFPLFVKPAKAGDSLGVDQYSLVENRASLVQKIQSSLPDYPQLLVEEYIAGREFTVLVAANPDGKTVRSFKPVEYVFPEGYQFKTYDLKTAALHPHANIPCNDAAMEQQLRSAAEEIFKGFNGVGYARLDFRVDRSGKLFFLEINFTCSVFYQDGLEGSADFIVQFDGIGKSGFLQHIIAEGMARYQRKQQKYIMKGNSIAGYGIYAVKPIQSNEVVFEGEERSQRLVTLEHVKKYWTPEEQETFRRYAYPVGRDVFIIWDNNPMEWAPQNHSCNPNTEYEGLNVIAKRAIVKGEELTLDYATFLDEHMEPFQCSCGEVNCRKMIYGNENLELGIWN